MIKLSKISTLPPKGSDEKKIKKLTRKLAEELSDLQVVLNAQKKYSVLVILQGMDASGKDGAVKNVFKECNPAGVEVHSFKKPTEEEFAHDFLWRIHKEVPEKGMIKVFNRSQYEDILIQRVHKWIDEDMVKQRMKAINAFEELIQFDNNTILFKFYLHLSNQQQAIELQERLDEYDKHWKHNPSDWEEREHWDEYMRCYEYVLNESKHPWVIVPVDQRWYRNYVILKTMVDKLRSLSMEYPPLEAI